MPYVRSTAPVPSRAAGPLGITPGPDGAMWFVASAGEVARISLQGVFSEYPTGGVFTGSSIVAGPDGALWFTASCTGVGCIGRITTAGAVSSFNLPAEGALSSYYTPDDITAGPNGQLWFTVSTGYTPDYVGSVALDAFVDLEPIPTSAAPGSTSANPFGIAPGPGGAMWFTHEIGNLVGTVR